MRDLRDLKKEDEEPRGKKPQPVLMIGLLGLLVFLALFFFFRRGKQIAPSSPPSASAPAPGPIAKAPPAKAPPEGGEDAVKDPTLKPGEMRFEPKKDEINPPPASGPTGQNLPSSKPAPPSALKPEPSPAPPKEDLTFFKTLKEKNGKTAAKTPLRPKPKKEPQVASAPKPSSNMFSLYTIQVASFTEPKGANDLAKKLKQKGFEAYVTTADVPDKGRRYRVRVGHFATRLDAQKAADQLHQNEKLGFLITSDK